MRPVLLALPVLLRLLPAAQGSAVPQLACSRRPTHVLVAATAAAAAATSTSTAAAASASPVVASTRFAAAAAAATAAAAARRSLSPAALARPLSSRPALRTSG